MRSTFHAEPAAGIDDEANYQNQAEPAAAVNMTAKVKAAATEQMKKNENEN
jgi:hypothetical protein